MSGDADVGTDDDCAQERRHRYSDDQVIDLGGVIFGFYCRTRKMYNRGGRRVRFANEWSDDDGPSVQVTTIILYLLLLSLSSSNAITTEDNGFRPPRADDDLPLQL